MRIDKVNNSLYTYMKQKIDAQKKLEEGKKNNKKKDVDKVEIKNSETKVNDGIDISAKARINAINDVREDKIEEVKKKIESGYYNTPEFIEKLADKLIDDNIIP